MNFRQSTPSASGGERNPPLQLPELENDRMTYSHPHTELLDMNSCVSFAAHGVPWRSGRWRYHQDFELHAIMAPFERAFVGDEVYSFASGNVVLIGPRLPHNFEFLDTPEEGPRALSPVLRFADIPLRQSMRLLPDLREAEPLLDRAQQGIEFVGFRDLAIKHLRQIKDSQGLERFSAFAALLYELSCWQDSRTLTTWRYRKAETAEDVRSGKIYTVLDYLRVNYMQEFSLSDISGMVDMHESALSRQFRRITGSNFTAFVAELRIAKACQLLLHTKRQIGSICYEVGFNNISNFNRHFLKRKGLTPSEYRALSQLGISK